MRFMETNYSYGALMGFMETNYRYGETINAKYPKSWMVIMEKEPFVRGWFCSTIAGNRHR